MISQTNILIIGNGTIDAFVLDEHHVDNDKNVVVAYNQEFSRQFEILDPPIVHGYKHRTNVDVKEHIRGIANREKPGGGGINSAISIATWREYFNGVNLFYVDVSQPDMLAVDQLRSNGIFYTFLGPEPNIEGYRPMPVNALFGGRKDRIVLKGPPLERVELTDQNRATIDHLVENCNAVFINSAKDESLVDAAISSANMRRIPLYFMVTPSLSPDFINLKNFGKWCRYFWKRRYS